MNLLSFNGESTNLFLDQEMMDSLSGSRVSYSGRWGDSLVFRIDDSTGRKLNRPEGAEHHFVNIDHQILDVEPFGKVDCEMQFNSDESTLTVLIPPVEKRPAARGRKPKSISGSGSDSIADLVRRLNSVIDDDTMTVSVVDNRIRISMQVTYE